MDRFGRSGRSGVVLSMDTFTTVPPGIREVTSCLPGLTRSVLADYTDAGADAGQLTRGIGWNDFLALLGFSRNRCNRHSPAIHIMFSSGTTSVFPNASSIRLAVRHST